jgi:hypothetical protein
MFQSDNVERLKADKKNKKLQKHSLLNYHCGHAILANPTNSRQIKVDGDEMRLWNEVLPAYVERCRK